MPEPFYLESTGPRSKPPPQRHPSNVEPRSFGRHPRDWTQRSTTPAASRTSKAAQTHHHSRSSESDHHRQILADSVEPVQAGRFRRKKKQTTETSTAGDRTSQSIQSPEQINRFALRSPPKHRVHSEQAALCNKNHDRLAALTRWPRLGTRSAPPATTQTR